MRQPRTTVVTGNLAAPRHPAAEDARLHRTEHPRAAPCMEGPEPGPHGLVLYWRANPTPSMTRAQELRPRTGYLIGNDAIPWALYRDDLAVMLHSRLPTLIYIGPGDRASMVDQPGTVLADFARPATARLGTDLGRQPAELLNALGVRASQIHHAAGSIGVQGS